MNHLIIKYLRGRMQCKNNCNQLKNIIEYERNICMEK